MLFVHDLFYCVDKILWWVHESNWDEYAHHYRYQKQLLQNVPGTVFVTKRSLKRYEPLHLDNPVVIGNSMETSVINRRVGLRDQYRAKLGLTPKDILVLQIGTFVSHKVVELNKHG